MKKLIIFLIVNILVSCNFLGPLDSSIQTKNVDYSEKDIIGTWKLDKFSYEYLSKKEKTDSIFISFDKDSSFIINNSKELFNGTIDNIKTTGSWEIIQTSKKKSLQLNYNNGSSQSGINIYQKGKDFQIWYFFGDPDSGERLRFLKN